MNQVPYPPCTLKGGPKGPGLACLWAGSCIRKSDKCEYSVTEKDKPTCAWCHFGFEHDLEPPLEIKRGGVVVAYVHEYCIRTYVLALKGVES